MLRYTWKIYFTTISIAFFAMSFLSIPAFASFSVIEYKNRVDTGVDVYIIDSGLSSHSNVYNDSKLTRYIDFTTDSRGENAFKDCMGHGSLVSSIFHTETKSNYNLNILKVFGCEGGLISDSIAVGKALNWLVQNMNEDNITIVNLSLSFGVPAVPGFDAVERLVEKGAIVIASAGNDNNDACSLAPGNISGVINVGNITLKADGTPSFRADSNYGDCVDLYAKGTYFRQMGERAIGSTSGTSFAAPIITARALDILAENRELSSFEVLEILQKESIAVGASRLSYIEPRAETRRARHYATPDEIN